MSKYQINFGNIPPDLEPDENITLWRYMSFSSLCEIVVYNYIPLIKISKFKDKSEGVILKEILSKVYNTPDHIVQYALQRYYETTYVSSWHKAQDENAAMWDRYTYGGDGVAIKTNAKLLIDSINSAGRPPAEIPITTNEYFSDENINKYEQEKANVINIPWVIVKSVKYIHNNPKDFEMDRVYLENGYDLLCFFYKLADFKDEAEIRILKSSFGNAFMYAKMPPSESRTHNEEESLRNSGAIKDAFALPINTVSKLIQQIVVSPYAHSNFINVVKEFIGRSQIRRPSGQIERIECDIVESRQSRWIRG